MRIDWRTDTNAPRCRVVDLDTGKQILYCCLADEETGEYQRWGHDGERFVIGPDRLVGVVAGVARLQIQPLTADEAYIISK